MNFILGNDFRWKRPFGWHTGGEMSTQYNFLKGYSDLAVFSCIKFVFSQNPYPSKQNLSKLKECEL